MRVRQLARRNRLVEAHLALADTIARAVVTKLPPSFELDDLIQAGHLGLIEAADRYRPRQHNNTPFSAYARHRVHGEIIRSIRRRHYTDATLSSIDEIPEAASYVALRTRSTASAKRRTCNARSRNWTRYTAWSLSSTTTARRACGRWAGTWASVPRAPRSSTWKRFARSNGRPV